MLKLTRERPPKLARLPELRPPGVTRTLTYLASGLFVLLVVYPLVRMLVELFRGELSVGGTSGSVWSALTSPATVAALWHTAVIVGCSGTLAILVGAFFAWLNERTNARMGFAADILPLVSMFVPVIAAAIGWVFLLNPNVGMINVAARVVLSDLGVHLTQGPLNIFSWYGLIFVYTLQLVPFAYLSVANGLQVLDPSLEEAARLSGARPLQIFRTISLPALRPALSSAVTLVLTMGFSFFAVPVIIGTEANITVLPVNIVDDITQSFPQDLQSAFAQAALLLVIVLGVQAALATQMRGSAGFATIAGKGGRNAKIDLGPGRWVARAVMLVYLALASIVPFIALVVVSLERFWTRDVSWGQLSLTNYRQVLNTPELSRALTDSLSFAAIGATIVVVIALLVCLFITYGHKFASPVVSVMLRVPVSVTHIVIALALIVSFGGPPFNWTGTAFILVTAYVILNIPQASFYVLAAIKQVGRSLTEASELSGASEGTTVRSVLIPLLAPGLVVAWTLSFVLIMGDVTASSMLASTSTPVLGFVMVDQWTYGTFPGTAALGVIITIVGSLIAIIPLILRRRLRIYG
jgi:iron(III) transport system permease protein